MRAQRAAAGRMAGKQMVRLQLVTAHPARQLNACCAAPAGERRNYLSLSILLLRFAACLFNRARALRAPLQAHVDHNHQARATRPPHASLFNPYTNAKQRARPAAAAAAAAPAAPPAAGAAARKLGDARPVFPFTAIVGQEEMKLALLLNVLDPKIGGVMVMGDRGTGKSTTIRALADLLPEMPVIAGDPFNSHPDDPELMSEEVRERLVLVSWGGREGVGFVVRPT